MAQPTPCGTLAYHKICSCRMPSSTSVTAATSMQSCHPGKGWKAMLHSQHSAEWQPAGLCRIGGKSWWDGRDHSISTCCIPNSFSGLDTTHPAAGSLELGQLQSWNRSEASHWLGQSKMITRKSCKITPISGL